MKIIDFSVNRPLAITMLILALVLVGMYCFPQLAIELMPDMEIPVAVVITNYSGASPTDVEKNVSKVIESGLSAVSDVDEINSISSNGLSMVIVMFNWGVDLDNSLNDIREKMDTMEAALPDGADKPTVFKMDINSTPIMYLALKGDDLVELKRIAEDTIQPRLERIEGVSSVSISGGREREIQIHLDVSKMESYGLSLSQISGAIASDSVSGTAGNVERGTKEYSLRVIGEYEDISDLENIQINLSTGGIISLKDIATIEDTYKDIDNYTYVDGQEALGLGVTKASGGNTVEVAEDTLKEIEDLQKNLPVGVSLVVIQDTSEYITDSINMVVEHGLLGALIALILLYLFLRSARSTFVIIIVLPVSIIATFSLMFFADITINVITLGGLLLGLGSLVDFAVVVLESIYRYRENGYGMIEAAKKGASEVGTAVLASASAQIVVFLPIVFVTGLAGILFKPMALVVIFSHIAALFFAFTMVPMMSSRLLVDVPTGDENIMSIKSKNPVIWFNKLIYKIKIFYKSTLAWCLKHRAIVVSATAGLLVISLILMMFVGMEFMTSTDEGMISIEVETATGTKLEDTANVIFEIEDIVKNNVPELDIIYSAIGGGGELWSTSSGNQGSVILKLVPLEQREASSEEIVERLRPFVTNLSGVDVSISSSSNSMGTTSSSDISLTINGDNMEVLKQLGHEIVDLIESVDGTREATTSLDDAKLETQVIVDREEASRYGLSVNEILSAVNIALDGKTVSYLRTDEEEVDIRLNMDYSNNITMSELNNLTLVSSSGAKIPLNMVASIENNDSPIEINRVDQSRQVTITADVFGKDLNTAVKEVKNKLEDFSMPEGYEISYGGSYESMTESFSSLAIAMILAVILMFMVMVALFESFFQPFIIMFALPPTFIGVVFGLLITGHSLNVPGFLGMIMLVGIVVNNSIVLVDYINTLRKRGIERNEAILQAGPVRLRPILITALTTILVLLPMAFGGGEGNEMQAPMAVVVVFGLSFSTLITLILVPVVYTLFDDLGKKISNFFRRFSKKEKLIEKEIENNG